jgi:hypothetical protein
VGSPGGTAEPAAAAGQPRQRGAGRVRAAHRRQRRPRLLLRQGRAARASAWQQGWAEAAGSMQGLGAPLWGPSCPPPPPHTPPHPAPPTHPCPAPACSKRLRHPHVVETFDFAVRPVAASEVGAHGGWRMTWNPPASPPACLPACLGALGAVVGRAAGLGAGGMPRQAGRQSCLHAPTGPRAYSPLLPSCASSAACNPSTLRSTPFSLPPPLPPPSVLSNIHPPTHPPTCPPRSPPGRMRSSAAGGTWPIRTPPSRRSSSSSCGSCSRCALCALWQWGLWVGWGGVAGVARRLWQSMPALVRCLRHRPEAAAPARQEEQPRRPPPLAVPSPHPHRAAPAPPAYRRSTASTAPWATPSTAAGCATRARPRLRPTCACCWPRHRWAAAFPLLSSPASLPPLCVCRPLARADVAATLGMRTRLSLHRCTTPHGHMPPALVAVPVVARAAPHQLSPPAPLPLPPACLPRRRLRGRWPTSTPRACCTATSPRPTCCWRRRPAAPRPPRGAARARTSADSPPWCAPCFFCFPSASVHGAGLEYGVEEGRECVSVWCVFRVCFVWVGWGGGAAARRLQLTLESTSGSQAAGGGLNLAA